MSTENIRYSCAVSGYRPISLLVTARSSMNQASGALLDVLLLHELEKLTQSVEDIFTQPLDWQRDAVCSDESEKDMLVLELTFDSSTLIDKAVLRLPASALPLVAKGQISQPEGPCTMSWRPLSCSLYLSEMNLTDDEEKNLHQGALLIIPESFQPVWCSKLRVGQELVLEGQYRINEDAWLQNEPDPGVNAQTHNGASADELRDATVDSTQGKLKVLFECEIAPAQLMSSTNTVAIGLSIAQHESVLSLEGGHGEKFQGSILSVGTGQAVLLEQTETLPV